MSNMLGMWLRKVPYPLVVDTRITAAKAGLDISTDELEATSWPAATSWTASSP